MVPQIWSAMDRIFFVILDDFSPFYRHNNPKNQNFEKMKKISGEIIILHKCTINDNHMMHSSWDMKRNGRNFLHFGPFLPFYPTNNPKSQNFQKLKKTLGDIINLHKCTINDNHMMYGSWDMKCDGQNLLSFWTVFCLFTPLTARKVKKKNEKK